MTRFNLREACLLDLSGELGKKAQTKLHETLQSDPRARALYERMKADFAILQGAAQPFVPETQKARISHSIKLTVQRGLQTAQREKSRRKYADVRNRWIYAAMASVSGVAACMVVMHYMSLAQQERADQLRVAGQQRAEVRAEVARADDSLHEYIVADTDNMTDIALASLSAQINSADAVQPMWTPVEPSGNRAKLLDFTDPQPEEEQHSNTRSN